MSRHQRKRARSADRDRVVEALTTAYVEGQLDDAEREERVSWALTAEGLDDLRPLVSDLQLPPGLRLAEPDVGGSTPGSVVLTGRPRSWRESKQRWDATPRWMKLLLGLLTVTVPAAVVMGIVTGPDDPGPILAPEGIERLVDEVDDTFGTTEVVEAEITDERALVTVPTDDGMHSETFGWDGKEFSLWYRGGVPQGQLVDLADVDAAALVETAEAARTTLGVEDVSHVSVDVGDPPAGPARLRFEVANEFREKASLETDLSGDEVLNRSPRS